MTELTLGGTAIRELSSSIWRNSKLTWLGLSECNKLKIVGNKLRDDHGLWSVTKLDLSGCTEINALSLWSILDGIQSLKQLILNECCNLESLPENIQNHSILKWLDLDDCRKLVSLAELPASLLYLTAVNCNYLDMNSTQRLLLENMVRTFSKDTPDEDGVRHFSLLSGVEVACNFGKEVDRCRISCKYLGTLISDHVLICWNGYNKQETGSHDFCNLSFQFLLQGQKEQLWWSTEGIKGCGVLPVYDLKSESELYVISSSREEIVKSKLKSSAQDSGEFDFDLKNDIDDSQEKLKVKSEALTMIMKNTKNNLLVQ
ncbi:disease resistance protein, putative [Medicago truncatula]|uniref:Disease resistance protein, putative n=1 Tax=Medicago truncatula TaxID=3880 RepID=A0A072UX96_MEDTR|nr:disease resistance protein, putative [Medicago truncatula]